MKTLPLTAAAACLALASAAAAHPGHGAPEPGWLHALDPVHAAPAALLALASAWAWRRSRRAGAAAR